MLKKFNMLALIVLLVVQTMIAPIAATARGIEDPVSTGEEATTTVGEELTEIEEGSEDIEDLEEGEPVDGEEIEVPSKKDGEPVDDEKVESEDLDAQQVEEVDLIETEGEVTRFTVFNALNATGLPINENIITEVKLYKILARNDKGEVEDSVELIPGEVIDLGSKDDEFAVELEYLFELPDDHDYVAGATYTIKIPNAFEVLANPVPTDLKEATGTTFATYIVNSSNEIIITFNENIEENYEVSGYIKLESDLKAHLNNSAAEQEIVFPISGDNSVKFPIKYTPTGTAIDKKGVVDKTYNSNKAIWTVDFNKQLETIENATLNDLIVEGDGDHEFVDGSTIEVYELTMNVDGTVDETKTKLYTGSSPSFGASFPMNLGTIDSAYRIVYETKINDSKGKTYKNKATLTGKEFPVVSAVGSVAVKRGEPLEKESFHYNEIDQIITWKVKYNYDEKSINQAEAILTDTFSENQQYVAGSIEIYEIDINPDTGIESGRIELTTTDFDLSNNSPNGLVIKFEKDIEKAYEITYQTEAIDRVFTNSQYTNFIEDEFGNNDTGTQWVEQQILIKSNNDDPKYDEKTTGWTVRMNTDEYIMKAAVFTDVLPVGFTPKDIVVRHGVATLTEGVGADYTFYFNTPNLVIEFNNDITEEVYITYITDINFNEIVNNPDKFINNAKVEWLPENGSTRTDKTGEATFTPDKYTQNNGFKGGSYNAETKVIDWEIGVNYNNVTLEDVVVTDYILGDQNFDIKDIEVWSLDLTGGPNGVEYNELLTEGDEENPGEYRVEEAVDSEDNEGFKVYLGDINTPYVIIFKTDLADQLIYANYDNTAVISSENRDDLELEASVEPYGGGKYTEKSIIQDNENPRMIHWNVNINFAQSTVDNVSITDTPSENQLLLEDTIKLYKTKVIHDPSNSNNPNRIEKDPDELLEIDEDYTLEIVEDIDGNKTFTIAFVEKTLKDAYVLEYDTQIMYRADEHVRNDIVFEGEQTIGIDTDTNFGERVLFNNITGGIDGAVGQLEITKVDAGNSDTKLEGAVFELYDSANKLLSTGTTDSEGKVTFKKLIHGEYTLKETTAPEGYVVGIANEKTVTVDADPSQITIDNEKITRHVELEKQDLKFVNEKLAGAVFELYKANDESTPIVVDGKTEFTTGEDGKFLLENLEAGDYFFKEVIAPVGYVKADEKHTFTIEANQTIVKKVPVNNDVILGSATLGKVDKDDETIKLDGATFKVVDSEGNTVTNENNETLENLESLVTKDGGVIEVTHLRPGTYKFVETAGPDHYKFNSANPETVEFTIGLATNEGGDHKTVTATNEIIKGGFTVTKTDGDSDVVLPGVVYELRDSDGNLVPGIIESDLTTDKDGGIKVENLRPGTYTLIETEPLEGYVAHAPVTIQIEKSQETLYEVELEKTANYLTRGSVELEKIDIDESGVTLKGAEFTLYDSETNIINENIPTNENGKLVVDNLLPGDYYFVETKAPEHYKLDDTEIEFTIAKVSPNEVIGDKQFVTHDNAIIRGSVELTKFGEEDEALKGAEFSLLDEIGNELQTGLESGADGKVLVDNLTPGNYQLVETNAPFGHDLDETPVKFEIVPSQKATLEVEMKNERTTSSVELTKVDNETGEPLEGATFELRQGETVLGERTTDENGLIFVADLKPGAYQFVETDAPEGYTVDPTPVEFTIILGQDATLKISTDNAIIKGDFELTKVDFDDETLLLEDVEFELQDAEGNVLQDDLVTDVDGKLLTKDLRPGEYTLVETKPLFGYEGHEPITFTIDKGQLEAKKVTITNKLIRGSVELTKVDTDTKEVLAGAVFELQDSEGNTLQEGLTTNADGILALDGLKPGDYQFVEAKAPEGYELDATPVSFEVVLDQKVIVELTKENNIILGGVQLIKVDKDEPNKVLSGAGFELQDRDGKTIQTGLITNEDGEINLSDLRPNDYQFVETKAPEGYELDATPIEFTIVKDQIEVAKVTAFNEGSSILDDGGEKGPKDPQDPQKPDGSQELAAGGELSNTATNIYNLALIGFGLLLVGLILFFVRRKKTE